MGSNLAREKERELIPYHADQIEKLNAAIKMQQERLAEAEAERKEECGKHQEEMNRLIEAMREGNSSECNIGVAGESGCGKSTFINGFCGLAEGDSAAAKTGDNEATMNMTKYKPPHIPNLALWDLPGAGTLTHPNKTYFYDLYLFMFNALVIMYDGRLKDDCADLIRQAVSFRLPFAVVRNKANVALINRKRKPEHSGKTEDQIIREIMAAVRQNTVDELAKYNMRIDPHCIFIINSWALIDQNEPRFEEDKLIQYLALAARNQIA